MINEIDILRQLYSLFNSRNIEGVLASLAEDVVWANAMDGGFVTGHDGVRAYWTSQFEQVRVLVEPITIRELDDDTFTG